MPSPPHHGPCVGSGTKPGVSKLNCYSFNETLPTPALRRHPSPFKVIDSWETCRLSLEDQYREAANPQWPISSMINSHQRQCPEASGKSSASQDFPHVRQPRTHSARFCSVLQFVPPPSFRLTLQITVLFSWLLIDCQQLLSGAEVVLLQSFLGPFL